MASARRRTRGCSSGGMDPVARSSTVPSRTGPDPVGDDPLSADTDAYLRRLGLEREPPSAAALHRIHRAQVETVPYETAWIHQGQRWSVDPGEAMRRVAHDQRGGYCFHLNGALAELLSALGYRVTRHVGGVHGPDGPDAAMLTNHLVLVVHDLPTADNPSGQWYVDAGLGDGLHEPLPLAAGTYQQGPFRFVLTETDDGVGDWHLTHDPAGSFAGMSFRAAAGGDGRLRRAPRVALHVTRVGVRPRAHRAAPAGGRRRHPAGMRPHPPARRRAHHRDDHRPRRLVRGAGRGVRPAAALSRTRTGTPCGPRSSPATNAGSSPRRTESGQGPSPLLAVCLRRDNRGVIDPVDRRGDL